MFGRKGVGGLGYDKEELDAIEKNEKRVGGTSPSKISAKTSGKGKKGKGRVR